ncbi:MSC_0622 family F1-like ATPase gamma subunit [Mycoplasma elephantis]|uniref:MSC_0622 family F1-like ATPase gamma subunit n=1 Tax=Mycoplasma elephantis TaxID=114882 RepID=UPI00048583B2|nr:hypothetical protein [Mycoplasma elephantis]
MDQRKIKQRIKNLNNIRLKINSEKNIFLINIMKLNNKLNFYIKNAIKNTENIFNIKNYYSLTHDLIFYTSPKNNIFQKIKNKLTTKKDLWIYLTETQKNSTDSYTRYEKTILEELKLQSNSDFITIGEKSYDFCRKNNLNIIASFTNSDKTSKLPHKIVQIIKVLYSENNYQNLYFVINSNKSHNKPFKIFPINDSNLIKLVNKDVKLDKNEYDIKKMKIYPNINKFIELELNIFLENIILALFTESSFYSAKVGLVTTNKMLKDLDEEILKINKKLIQYKREKEIEEITLLTSNNLDFKIN